MEINRIAQWYRLNTETLRKQYKFHLSNFTEWDQKDHCEDWLLFPENLGPRLSLDETCLSNGELYTVVTNKSAKGKKSCLVALVKGTKASVVSAILMKIPMRDRLKVKEVTLDLDNSMDWISIECFPNAEKINDRFHVQQLISEAVQEMRIKKRWQAIEEENEAIAFCRKQRLSYRAILYSNGDSKKQLLARSRYLLFKPINKWTASQKERAALLFGAFPELQEGYNLSMMFRAFYEYSKTRKEAKEKLNIWYAKVKEKNFKSFQTASASVKTHEGTILNYFSKRATNASAESFNAKLKGFRALVRGVTDRKFFLFRITTIYG